MKKMSIGLALCFIFSLSFASQSFASQMNVVGEVFTASW